MENAREVLLVGSVPLGSAEAVFTTCAAALGPKIKRLPDGETGPRTNWIAWQRPLLAANPALRQLPTAGPFPVFVLNPTHAGPVEFGPLGIRFVSLYPGFVATEAVAGDGMPAPMALSEAQAVEHMLRALRREPLDYLFPWRMAWLVRLSLLELSGQETAQTQREALKDRIRAYVANHLRDPALSSTVALALSDRLSRLARQLSGTRGSGLQADWSRGLGRLLGNDAALAAALADRDRAPQVPPGMPIGGADEGWLGE